MANTLRAALPGYRWEGVERVPYKAGGEAPFRAISRQVLFSEAALGCELRYFEMDAGGHSTLERHEHWHAVMILRGRGTCLIGDRVHELREHDLMTIPSNTWHQFRASEGVPMGFLCMVNRERDKPALPTEEELAALRADRAIAGFLET